MKMLKTLGVLLLIAFVLIVVSIKKKDIVDDVFPCTPALGITCPPGSTLEEIRAERQRLEDRPTWQKKVEDIRTSNITLTMVVIALIALAIYRERKCKKTNTPAIELNLVTAILFLTAFTIIKTLIIGYSWFFRQDGRFYLVDTHIILYAMSFAITYYLFVLMRGVRKNKTIGNESSGDQEGLKSS